VASSGGGLLALRGLSLAVAALFRSLGVLSRGLFPRYRSYLTWFRDLDRRGYGGRIASVELLEQMKGCSVLMVVFDAAGDHLRSLLDYNRSMIKLEQRFGLLARVGRGRQQLELYVRDREGVE